MAAEVSILKHQNRGLQNAIELQKKKNKKSKRLNLVGEEAGGPECYSPAKVAAAREYQDELEAKEAQELVAKEARKV